MSSGNQVFNKELSEEGGKLKLLTPVNEKLLLIYSNNDEENNSIFDMNNL